MRSLASLVLVTAASCHGASPPAAKAPPAHTKPPGPTGGEVNLDRIDARELLFVDGGRLLIGYSGYSDAGKLVAIDPFERTVVGETALSSARGKHPSPRKGLNEELSWSVSHAAWAWDPAAGSLVGVVSLGSWGDALDGLAWWAPGTTIPPAAITNEGTLCWPLALSADRRRVAVVRNVAPERYCDGSATEIIVLDIGSSAAVAPPVDVGVAKIDRVATFSRDGRYLAIGAGAVFVQDLQSHEVTRLDTSKWVRAISMHPSQPRVAWATWDDEVATWQVGDEAPRRLGRGSSVAFSPDGGYLAIADRGLKLLDATTFEYVNDVPLHLWNGADAMVFSDDSSQIALLASRRVWVWQIAPVAPAGGGAGDWFAALKPLPIPPPEPPPPIHPDGKIDGVVLVDGKPVAGAKITLVPDEQEYADAVALAPVSRQSATDGTFTFDELPAIHWNARVVVPGATIGGLEVNLRKRKVQHAEVKLKAAVTIVGTVRGPDKKPAKGLTLFHAADYSYPELEIVADERGRFVIDHLYPGTKPYVITARRADGAVRSQEVEIGKPGRVKVEFTLASITDENVLRVLVVDDTGAPVAGARVTVESQQGRTDASGRFSIDVSNPHSSLVRVISERGFGQAGFSLPRSEELTIQVAPH